jgi:hypothetical protein
MKTLGQKKTLRPPAHATAVRRAPGLWRLRRLTAKRAMAAKVMTDEEAEGCDEEHGVVSHLQAVTQVQDEGMIDTQPAECVEVCGPEGQLQAYKKEYQEEDPCHRRRRGAVQRLLADDKHKGNDGQRGRNPQAYSQQKSVAV